MTRLARCAPGILIVLVACDPDPSDPGNQNSGNGNANDTPICGDGTVQVGEACDEGAANSDLAVDGCRTTCRWAYCGDGVVDTDEVCDDGAANGQPPSACRVDCQPTTCGDGHVLGDEVCDPAAPGGEACLPDCTQDLARCGDAALDPGEDCDDGLTNSDVVPNACRLDCHLPRCGDGILDSGERCDDGDTEDDLGCSADCQSFCGDHQIDPGLGEVCDDGETNGVSPAGCRGDCQPTDCGDGYLGGDEGCDDGNLAPGDGCDPACAVSARWQCQGSPSVCQCADFFQGAACDTCRVLVSVQEVPFDRDGKRWDSALATVQEGIDVAAALGDGCEVWVAGGTYYTYRFSPLDTVALRTNVAVYGGFGGDEVARAERDPALHPTRLDGAKAGDLGRQVFHVVTASGVEGARLDGLIVGSGNAAGWDVDQRGGGLFAYGSEVTLVGCEIADNGAGEFGPGIFAYASTLSLEGSVVHRNRGGGKGAGLYAEQSDVTITGSLIEDNLGGIGGAVTTYSSRLVATDSGFRGNEAISDGGAIVVLGGQVDLARCEVSGNRSAAASGISVSSTTGSIVDSTFTGNRSTGGGAGGGLVISGTGLIRVERCRFEGNAAAAGGGLAVVEGATGPELYNLVFIGNEAVGRGGGLITARAGTDVRHCTFLDNTAGVGPAAYFGDGMSGQPVLSNSILWGDDLPQIAWADGAQPLVSHCDVAGLPVGLDASSFDLDPGFVDAGAGDLRLAWGSPCIDAADDARSVTLDFDGASRQDVIAGGAIADMGAYEYQP
jgi:cysteine-rich repeat protein